MNRGETSNLAPVAVTLEYFASLREEAGCAHETLEVPPGTYADLYRHRQSAHGFRLPVELIQVAVDDAFVPMDHPIAAGARVVFIPPIAGG